MKRTNLYFHAVLTILTICMIGIFIQNQFLINELKKEKAASSPLPPAYLSSQLVSIQAGQHALVPVHADGSIDVNIKQSAEPMDVNIKQVNGYNLPKGHLPVTPELTKVNITQIDGNTVLGNQLPVRTEINDVNISQVGGNKIGSYIPIREW